MDWGRGEKGRRRTGCEVVELLHHQGHVLVPGQVEAAGGQQARDAIAEVVGEGGDVVD
jgi:hypothetical protein